MGRNAVYDDEFKRQAITLVKTSGKSVSEIARNLGISESALRKWILRAGDNTKQEVDEILKLRRELSEVKMERDILKKAMAVFSRNQ
jgi:transposase